ncbi:GNAT family N-acetyltransferase [Streptomyces griseocarneus]|nr:GNAT family N-acetyltransferase [Streptomyces griseocarneus]
MIVQRNLRPRSATVEDIEELVRLRAFLLSAGQGHYVACDAEEDRAWRESYRDWLADVLAPGTQGVHVAVMGDVGALAACAIAVVDRRAPVRGALNGRVGWVQTVVVDPAMRRRGLGRVLMEYVLDWFRANDTWSVTLQTTADGAELYRKLGFRPTGEDSLTLVIPDRRNPLRNPVQEVLGS